MMIELLVASLVLVVGVFALVGAFDSSRNLVTTSEMNQVASHEAEADLEKVLAMQFGAVGLEGGSPPAPSTVPTNPDYYVSGSSYQWDQGSTGPHSDPLVLNGQLAHTQTWNDGQSRLSGTIYRYVTSISDPCCAGSNYAKRVTIAVTITGGRGLYKPVLTASIVIDPNAT